MLAQSLVTFGQNIYLLIGLLFLLGVLGVLIFSAWTGFNVWRFQRGRDAAARQAAAARLGPDGQPLPPAAEGLCDRCQRAFNRVYFTAAGPRLCPTCYAAALPPSPAVEKSSAD